MKQFLLSVITILFFCVDSKAQAANYYSDAEDCKGDIFAGVHRAYVKTHKAAGPVYYFHNLEELYDSGLLVPDDVMRSREPKISKHAESERVEEENVNVVIEEAYIYGIYREEDNDYHIVLGNGELDVDHMLLLNVEVAGLPGDGEHNRQLETVRERIKEYFGEISCSSKKYKPVEYMVPVKIKGSLFFDVDHRAGVSGFGDFKSKTSWEIHPITYIKIFD